MGKGSGVGRQWTQLGWGIGALLGFALIAQADRALWALLPDSVPQPLSVVGIALSLGAAAWLMVFVMRNRLKAPAGVWKSVLAWSLISLCATAAFFIWFLPLAREALVGDSSASSLRSVGIPINPAEIQAFVLAMVVQCGFATVCALHADRTVARLTSASS